MPKKIPESQQKRVNSRRVHFQNNRLYKDQHAASRGIERSAFLNTVDSGELVCEEGEKSWRVKQDDLTPSLDLQTSARRFDISLDKLGPYSACYSANGNSLCISGGKGHFSVVEWKSRRVRCEEQFKESIHAATYLHDDRLIAVAQKNFVYIYTYQGAEAHQLKDHQHPFTLQFLPLHFLLVSGNRMGIILYQDISTGTTISRIATRRGPLHCLSQNPYNGVILTGHAGGRISMWTPNSKEQVVEMNCGTSGEVRQLAVDPSGRYMSSCCTDGIVRFWDIRNTHQQLHHYTARKAFTACAVSQRGLFAFSYGEYVEVWKDVWAKKPDSPYMSHKMPKLCTVNSLQFCPYEDVLGIGHSKGFASVIIPGSGEPNIDFRLSNPYETRLHKSNRIVKQVVDKLSPATICLDPTQIGTVAKPKVQADVAEREKLKLAQQLKSAVRGLAVDDDLNYIITEEKDEHEEIPLVANEDAKPAPAVPQIQPSKKRARSEEDMMNSDSEDDGVENMEDDEIQGTRKVRKVTGKRSQGMKEKRLTKKKEMLNDLKAARKARRSKRLKADLGDE